MKKINLMNNEEKTLFGEKLNKMFASSNINILLGAGFSMPVLKTLGDVEQRLTVAKKEQNDIEIYNIEKEFFTASILPLKNKVIVKEGSIARNRFIHTLIDLIAARHSSVLHKTLNIFTTNYDNLIELSLEEKHVDYFDGFAGKITPIFSTNNYGKIVSKQSAINNKTTELVSVNLIKLHGSLYWSVSKDCILFRDFIERINQLESVVDVPEKFVHSYESEFCIVNPNEEKYNLTVLNANYYDQIRLLGNELEKHNTVLIAFGFSFNDEHLKVIINRALENPTLTILIFAYDQDAVESYEEKFKNFNNVIVLYNATKIEEGDLRYETLKLDHAGKFLEDIYNAIK